MKKILITLTLLVAVLSFISCEKETEGIATGIVYYPVFVNSGEQLNVVAVGESFTVPEVTIFDGPTDITASADVVGSIDLDTPGYYEVTYTATTGDGFTSSYNVVVFVYDPNYAEAPIIGNYNGILTNRGGGPVTISEYNKGVYKIDDAFCGYYNVYREYGSVYTAPGYLIYIGGNEFILRNCTSVWGPIYDKGGIDYDPITGVLSWIGQMDDGYSWNDWLFVLTPVAE